MHRNFHIDGMLLPSSCSASDWLKRILLAVNQSEAGIVSDESFFDIVSQKSFLGNQRWHCEISAVFSSYQCTLFSSLFFKGSQQGKLN